MYVDCDRFKAFKVADNVGGLVRACVYGYTLGIDGLPFFVYTECVYMYVCVCVNIWSQFGVDRQIDMQKSYKK